MQPVSIYRDQHAEILGMVEELRPLLNEESLRIRLVAKSARDLLCEIANKLDQHLRAEDKELYPDLLTHVDEKVRSTARGFITGQQALRQWSDQYRRKWLEDCSFEFTDEFLTDTNELLELVAARVDREDRYLFPKLEGTPGEGPAGD